MEITCQITDDLMQMGAPISQIIYIQSALYENILYWKYGVPEEDMDSETMAIFAEIHAADRKWTTASMHAHLDAAYTNFAFARMLKMSNYLI